MEMVSFTRLLEETEGLIHIDLFDFVSELLLLLLLTKYQTVIKFI